MCIWTTWALGGLEGKQWELVHGNAVIPGTCTIRDRYSLQCAKHSVLSTPVQSILRTYVPVVVQYRWSSYTTTTGSTPALPLCLRMDCIINKYFIIYMHRSDPTTSQADVTRNINSIFVRSDPTTSHADDTCKKSAFSLHTCHINFFRRFLHSERSSSQAFQSWSSWWWECLYHMTSDRLPSCTRYCPKVSVVLDALIYSAEALKP